MRTTYELVLLDDGEEERYIDHPLEVGQEIQVDLSAWVVTAEEPGQAPWASGRFICTKA
jgi:hypothetical protein